MVFPRALYVGQLLPRGERQEAAMVCPIAGQFAPAVMLILAKQI